MDDAVAELVGLLPEGVVVTSPDAVDKYRFDWTHDATAGTPLAAVRAETAAHVRPVTMPSGTTVLLVADGHCANTTAGEGNPIEIMDLSLALQLRALDLLASTTLPPGVHDLPAAIDDEVAASQLAAAGIRIDVPSAAQRRAAAAW